jgi:hypothetical protein
MCLPFESARAPSPTRPMRTPPRSQLPPLLMGDDDSNRACHASTKRLRGFCARRDYGGVTRDHTDDEETRHRRGRWLDGAVRGGGGLRAEPRHAARLGVRLFQRRPVVVFVFEVRSEEDELAVDIGLAAAEVEEERRVDAAPDASSAAPAGHVAATVKGHVLSRLAEARVAELLLPAWRHLRVVLESSSFGFSGAPW